MRTFFGPILAAIVLILPSALCLAQVSKTREGRPMAISPYYPISVGATWTYSLPQDEVTITVVRHENLGGTICARMEAVMAGNDSKNSEYIRVEASGVYRYQAAGQTINGPLRFLKLPPKSGARWSVDSTVTGQILKGDFTSTTVKQITVNGKTYHDVVVCQSDNFTIGGQKVPHAYYFAKGVGLVKQVMTFGGAEVAMELLRFNLP